MFQDIFCNVNKKWIYTSFSDKTKNVSICKAYELLSFVFQDMFDLILSLGGDLTIANRQGLTPLQLAAFMAKREVSCSLYKNDTEC